MLQENAVLKSELELLRLKCKNLVEENRRLRQASVDIVSSKEGREGGGGKEGGGRRERGMWEEGKGAGGGWGGGWEGCGLPSFCVLEVKMAYRVGTSSHNIPHIVCWGHVEACSVFWVCIGT